MKQKLFLGTLLLGALTLNSCVDDTESASVTAVRQAKVEQLKSIADYNKAQAEAAVILANAEAAAKEAAAELDKANAALAQAEAEYRNAQTEEAKARAEEALANAQVAKARAEAELQTIAAQLEIDLINQKKNLLIAQQEYEAAVKKGDQDKIDELTILFTAYQTASSTLLGVQQDLARNKIDLAKQQAGLTTVEENIQKQIANYNEYIAGYQGDIATAQAYIDTYEKYTNTAEAKAAYEKAILEQIDIQKTYDAKYKAYSEAYDASSAAQTKLENSAYVIAAEYFMGRGNETNKNETYNWINGISINLTWSSDKKWYYEAQVPGDNGITSIPVFYGDNTDYENRIEYTLVEGERPLYNNYRQCNQNYNLIAGGFDAYFKAAQASIDAQQGKNLADAKKATADAEKVQKAKADAQATAKTARDAAKAAVDKAGENVTTDQQNALIAAEAALTTANDELTAANTDLENAQNVQGSAQNSLDAINEALAENKAQYDIMVAQSANNDSNIKAYNDASEASAKAWVAQRIADQELSDKNSEVGALWTVLNDSQNIDSTIKMYEDRIENYTQLIVFYEERIADLENNGTVTAEQAIETLQNTIANQEEQIKVLQKQVDAAKAALDAAMAEDAPAE